MGKRSTQQMLRRLTKSRLVLLTFALGVIIAIVMVLFTFHVSPRSTSNPAFFSGVPENISKAVEFLSLAGDVGNVSQYNTYFYKVTIGSGDQAGDVFITSDGSFIIFPESLVEIERSDEEGIRSFIEQKVPSGTPIEFVGKESEGVLTRYEFVVGGYKYIFYLTPDGKLVLPGGVIKVFSAPTTERLKIMLFVMSFCPFGQAAERSMKPVYDLLKNYAEFEVHYVIYPSQMYSGYEEQYCMESFCSMHGIAELREDIRQMCIQKYYPEAFWDYIYDIDTTCSLSNIDTCWLDVAESKGIDTSKIQACVENEGTTLLSQEFALNEQYNVRGSPTLIINGVTYNWVRTPNAYKWAICSTFASQPEECNITLENTGGVSGTC